MSERCNLCAEGFYCQEPAIPLVQGRFEIRGEGRVDRTFYSEKIVQCAKRIKLIEQHRQYIAEQMQSNDTLIWQDRCYGCASVGGFICQNSIGGVNRYFLGDGHVELHRDQGSIPAVREGVSTKETITSCDIRKKIMGGLTQMSAVPALV